MPMGKRDVKKLWQQLKLLFWGDETDAAAKAEAVKALGFDAGLVEEIRKTKGLQPLAALYVEGPTLVEKNYLHSTWSSFKLMWRESRKACKVSANVWSELGIKDSKGVILLKSVPLLIKGTKVFEPKTKTWKVWLPAHIEAAKPAPVKEEAAAPAAPAPKKAKKKEAAPVKAPDDDGDDEEPEDEEEPEE